MLMENERKLIVEYCQKLLTTGLVKGTGGNISIADKKNKMYAICPSGLDYFKTESEDIVILDFDGNIIEGKRKPSSEHVMHRVFYTDRDDINAVVHTHSMYATTIATMRWDLPAASYLLAFGGINVRCAKYASFGTPELAKNALEAMKDRNAVLLANHGMIGASTDIDHAFSIAEQIEYCAELYFHCKCIGEPIILDDEEMEFMKTKFQTYGK